MTDAFSATETHVPRAWYDSQRAALIRAEGQIVALIARCTELHKALERKNTGRNTAAEEPRPTAKSTAKPLTKQRAASSEIEITF